MAHIADLHNNGRCGLHRTIESARGAYADLIRKERKSLESAARRAVLADMQIKCPRCALAVSQIRCGNCCYYPVPLPGAAEVDRRVEDRKRKDHTLIFDRAAYSEPSSFVLTNTVATKSRPSSSQRLVKLEAMIADEKAHRVNMLERVKKLATIVEQLDR